MPYICVGRTFLSTYEPRWLSTVYYTQDIPTLYLPDVPGSEESSALPWMKIGSIDISTPILPDGFVGLSYAPQAYTQIPADIFFSFKPGVISFLTIHVVIPNPDEQQRPFVPTITVDQHIAQGLPDLFQAVVATEQWFRINGQPVIVNGDVIRIWSGFYPTNPIPVPTGLDIPAITPLMPYPPYDPLWTGYYLAAAVITGSSHWTVNGRPMAQMGISSAPPLGVNFFSGQSFPYFSA